MRCPLLEESVTEGTEGIETVWSHLSSCGMHDVLAARMWLASLGTLHARRGE